MKHKGYTLVELIVVIFIAGLMLYLAAPSLRNTLLDDRLQSTARQIADRAQELRADAVREQMNYVLHFDLNQGRYWTYSADMTPEKRDEQSKKATALPADVRITDIYAVGDAKKTDGEFRVLFLKDGVVHPTVLHLGQEEKALTLIFEPFLNKIRMVDQYVEFPENTDKG